MKVYEVQYAAHASSPTDRFTDKRTVTAKDAKEAIAKIERRYKKQQPDLEFIEVLHVATLD